MFRVIVNNKMFDLQVLLLMCWINYVEWATPEHGKNFSESWCCNTIKRGAVREHAYGFFGIIPRRAGFADSLRPQF